MFIYTSRPITLLNPVGVARTSKMSIRESSDAERNAQKIGDIITAKRESYPRLTAPNAQRLRQTSVCPTPVAIASRLHYIMLGTRRRVGTIRKDPSSWTFDAWKRRRKNLQHMTAERLNLAYPHPTACPCNAACRCFSVLFSAVVRHSYWCVPSALSCDLSITDPATAGLPQIHAVIHPIAPSYLLPTTYYLPFFPPHSSVPASTCDFLILATSPLCSIPLLLRDSTPSRTLSPICTSLPHIHDTHHPISHKQQEYTSERIASTITIQHADYSQSLQEARREFATRVEEYQRVHPHEC
jgi:hypothetical protein